MDPVVAVVGVVAAVAAALVRALAVALYFLPSA